MTSKCADSDSKWTLEKREIIDYMEETSKEVQNWSPDEQRMFGTYTFGFFSEKKLKDQEAS